LKKKAKEFPVPTNDLEVKMCLRQLGVPVCLFGEDAGFRRERLKVEIAAFFIREERPPTFCALNQSKFKNKRRGTEDSEESYEAYDGEGN
jgi:U4/U6 small nuclear ribonucleoprotein PRP4